MIHAHTPYVFRSPSALAMSVLGEDGMTDALAALGVDPVTMTHLGSGDRGAAFDIGAGRVAKFTTDPDEAAVSEFVSYRPLKHVWRIDAVRALTPAQASRLCAEVEGMILKKGRPMAGKPMWVIVGQNTGTVPDRGQMRKAILWIKAAGIKGSLGLAPGRAAALEAALDEITRTGGSGDATAGAWVGYAKFILSAYKELRRAGIGFHDLHTGNVRQGPDGPLLIDLGYSSPTEDMDVPPIPPLEAA